MRRRVESMKPDFNGYFVVNEVGVTCGHRHETIHQAVRCKRDTIAAGTFAEYYWHKAHFFAIPNVSNFMVVTIDNHGCGHAHGKFDDALRCRKFKIASDPLNVLKWSTAKICQIAPLSTDYAV